MLAILLMFSMPKEKKEENKYDKNLATIENSVNSDSGKYKLNIEKENQDGAEVNRFSIISIKYDNVIFKCSDVFRTRDTLYFLWDTKDRVWVYSGDVGTFFGEMSNSGNWEKNSYANNKQVEVPVLLKKMKPNYFQ